LVWGLALLGQLPSAFGEPATWLTWPNRESCPTAADIERRVTELLGGEMQREGELRVQAHGATLDGLRLRAAIPNTAPFDAWCALQQPISSGVECQFSLDAPTPYMVSNGHCKVDEQTVDCSWMLLGKAGVCSCTATECFAPGFVEGGGLDVRANDDGSELTGTFLSETVHLTRVAP
jgi:hypothetical protein